MKFFESKEPPGLGNWEKKHWIQRNARSRYLEKKSIGFKEPLVLGISKASKKLPGFMEEPAKDPSGFGWIFEIFFSKEFENHGFVLCPGI